MQIKAAGFLEEFRRTWHLHHPISAEQVRLGGRVSIVAGVSFYLGQWGEVRSRMLQDKLIRQNQPCLVRLITG